MTDNKTDDNISLGDRMKMYENAEAKRALDKSLPCIIRLDGKAFHSFTKGMNRPFDENFNICMSETTKYLMDKTNAKIGYHQSDEITLVMIIEGKSQGIYGLRVHKLCSILASEASVMFNDQVRELFPPKYAKRRPVFDCRAWNVPTREEAANSILWREDDAIKNSVSALAQSKFGHHSLHKKNTDEKISMLSDAGVLWNDLPDWCKKGTYFKRITRTNKFTPEEIEKLPPKHEAVLNPDLEFQRSSVEAVDMPRLSKMPNKVELLFGPILED